MKFDTIEMINESESKDYVSDNESNMSEEPRMEDFEEPCESYDSDYDSDDDRWRIEPVYNVYGTRAPKPVNMKSQKYYTKQKEILEKLELNKELEKQLKKEREFQMVQEAYRQKQIQEKLEMEKQKEIIEKEEAERAKQMEKTKMCYTVIVKGKVVPQDTCPKYGENCKYAHNLAELKIRECKFGDSCRFVKYLKSGGIVNVKGEKVCEYMHKGELQKEYYNRTGINNNKTKQTKNTIVNTKPVQRPKTVFNPWANKQNVKKSEPSPPKLEQFVKEIKETKEVKIVKVEKPKEEKVEWKTIDRRKQRKTNNQTKILKNSLCRFVRNCRHGSRCNFAHSLNELNECRFGEICRNIRVVNGVYVNTSSFVCRFKHPGEKLENNYKRCCK